MSADIITYNSETFFTADIFARIIIGQLIKRFKTLSIIVASIWNFLNRLKKYNDNFCAVLYYRQPAKINYQEEGFRLSPFIEYFYHTGDIKLKYQNLSIQKNIITALIRTHVRRGEFGNTTV